MNKVVHDGGGLSCLVNQLGLILYREAHDGQGVTPSHKIRG